MVYLPLYEQLGNEAKYLIYKKTCKYIVVFAHLFTHMSK